VSPTAHKAPLGTARRPGGWDLSVRAFRCWLTLYRRYWRSSVWSSVFGPLFYLGAMGYGLGSLVDKNGTAAIGGVPYVVFVAPAVLVTQARIYIAARATVLRPVDIYRGHLLFIALRIALNSAFFVLIMAAFGLIRSAWAAALLPAALLLGVAFAAPVAAWCVTLRTQTPMSYLFRFGSVPLMLFSGTFFPISSLPGWLRPVAYATPLWHGVALCRALSLGTVDAGSVAIHVGYLVVMTGLGLWWGSRTYNRRLYV
jgi:lipooligosaccharide transport system permease protein